MDSIENTPEPTPSGVSAERKIDRHADDLKNNAIAAKEEAKQKASRAYEDAKQGARQVAKNTTAYANTVVSDQKSALVTKLDEYKGAILAASDKLESDDDSVAAQNIRKAANGLENVTGYLKDTDPSELYEEAGRLARKHPEIVFGGMFLAGLGIARFLKSSAEQRRSEQSGFSRQGYAHTQGADAYPPASTTPTYS